MVTGAPLPDILTSVTTASTEPLNTLIPVPSATTPVNLLPSPTNC